MLDHLNQPTVSTCLLKNPISVKMVDVFPLAALPAEMQRMIFFKVLKLLTIEVLKCRQVCWSWKEAIDSMGYDELTIERQSYSRYDQVTNHRLTFKTDVFLEKFPRKSIFKNVKKMVIFLENVVSPLLKNFYSCFKLLEDLRIHHYNYRGNFQLEKFEIKLNLKFLKKLHLAHKLNGRYFLNTPQLEFFKCDDLRCYRIQKKGIKLLDIILIQGFPFRGLSNFKCLEILVIRQLFCRNERNFFKLIPNLREVHFEFPFKYLHLYDTDYSQAPIKVKFFFFGIERSNFKKLPKIRKKEFTTQTYCLPFLQSTRFILRHLSLMNSQNFCEPRIDYKPLEDSNLDWTLFYKKISKVGALALKGGVKDPHNLLRFIERTRPECLAIKVCKMSSSLLNELPKRFQFVSELQLDLAKIKDISRLDFILEMRNLTTFKSINFFSFSFLKRLLSEIDSLKNVVMNLGPYYLIGDFDQYPIQNLIFIWRGSPYSYKKTGVRNIGEFPNKKKMIDFLNVIEPQLTDRPLAKLYELIETPIDLDDEASEESK